MIGAAFQDIGNCFLASMRVVRKTCSLRYVEVIEHEEGSEMAELGRADRPPYCRASAL